MFLKRKKERFGQTDITEATEVDKENVPVIQGF
jgi:hypothetical protein